MNRRWAVSPAMLLCGLLVTGCNSTADSDLCQQYDRLSARVDEIRDVQPDATNAAEIQAEVEAFQDALDQFQAVADGRFDQAISDLRAAVDEVADSAVATGQEAAERAQEAMESVRATWAVLEQVAQNQCT